VVEIAARTGFAEAFTHLTERTARVADLTTSVCAVLAAEACNTGPEPFIRYDNPALRRDRLAWVKQNYVRDDTLTAANARLVAAQNRIALTHALGGGEVASADGIRFVVPIRTVHAGPNPKYFAPLKGVTWYNLLSDQFTGLNAIPTPGTLRDSLVLLAVVLEQQTDLKPTQIMTDTGRLQRRRLRVVPLVGLPLQPTLGRHRRQPLLAHRAQGRLWQAQRPLAAPAPPAAYRAALGRHVAADWLTLAGAGAGNGHHAHPAGRD
jgi:hypothetical protein